jgi:hypothetical protein
MGKRKYTAKWMGMRLLLVAVALPFLIFSAAQAAHAQSPGRIALLIGNQGYVSAVGPLKKTHDDIKVVGNALKKLGFKVTSINDADYRQMDIAIRQHVRRVRKSGPGTVSFFYYSGHGIANPNTGYNYLVPIDVQKADAENIWDESFEQSVLIDRLNKQAPQAIHFVVLDACRNELNLTSAGNKSLGTDKGFRPVSDIRGMLIAYATAERKTAADTGDFARILAEEIVKPGIEAVSAFRNVQLRVEETLGQEPWMSLRYLPKTYLAGQVSPPPPRPAPQPPRSDASLEWQAIQNTKSEAVLKEFLRRYGDSAFAGYAQTRLNELSRRKEVAVGITDLPSSDTSLDSGLVAPTNSSQNQDKAAIIFGIQQELKRIGCYTGQIDGDWGPKSKAALDRFESSKITNLANPTLSSDNLDKLKKIDKTVCVIIENKISKTSTAVNTPANAEAKRNSSAKTTSASSGTLSTCYQRAQRYCSNPDNSSAIGYQACMTQAKKGCRDQ